MLKCMRNIHTLVMLVVKYVDVSTSARIYHRILACRRSMHRRGRRGTLATLWLSMEAVFLLLCACKLIMRQRPHFFRPNGRNQSSEAHSCTCIWYTMYKAVSNWYWPSYFRLSFKDFWHFLDRSCPFGPTL